MTYNPLPYERSGSPDPRANLNTQRRGPLRFEEGIATDTDVPMEFGRGAYGDTAGNQRGRPTTCIQSPQETMRERAHVGSSTWIEAPTMLSDFMIGARAGEDEPYWEYEMGSNVPIRRYSPAVVTD
jgi:hypothetical protein